MEGQITPPPPAAQSSLNLESRQVTQQQVFNLPVGAQFVAQVIGGDKNGNAIIRTGGSDLILSSPLALSKGAQLSLKVESASGSIPLQLLSVDGKLPASQPQQLSNQLQNPQQQLPLLKLVNVTNHNTVKVDTANVPAQAQGAASGQTAIQGQQVAATAAPKSAVVLGSSSTSITNGVVVQPVPEILQGIKANISLSFDQNAANKILTNLPPNLKAGTHIDFKITNLETPQQTQPANPLANAAKSMEGVKVETQNQALKGQEFHQQAALNSSDPKQNFTPNSTLSSDGSIKLNALVLSESGRQMIVDTKLGTIQLNNPFETGKIKPGMVMNLQITGFGGEADIAQLPKENPLKTLTGIFSTLAELNHALNAAAPNAQNALAKVTGLDGLFMSRLIGFMTTVKDGNINNWLSSELLDTLDEQTREQLVSKLRGDFSQLRSLLNDSSNSWQTLLFPVFDGSELQQARLHVRYLEDENSENPENSATRFIVEIETGFFGEIQLDGFFRRKSAGNNFDLIIRSLKPLDADVKNEISTIYYNTQEITGFRGDIDFSVARDFPIRPLDEKFSQTMHSDKGIDA